MDKYKYALGVPGEGIHFHVFGIAIMDVVFTIAGAGLISYFSGVNFFLVCFLLFVLGFFMHLLFRVPTSVMVALGLEAPVISKK
jgi:hypothetical protein